jgi:hydrogenase expression/formation protein HypC
MCLAVPFRLTKVDGVNAVGEKDGVSRDIRVDFLKDPKVGDYVVCHAGFAIERLDEDQAKADLEAWNELEEALATL